MSNPAKASSRKSIRATLQPVRQGRNPKLAKKALKSNKGVMQTYEKAMQTIEKQVVRKRKLRPFHKLIQTIKNLFHGKTKI